MDGWKLHGIIGERGLRRVLRLCFSFRWTVMFGRCVPGLLGCVVEEDLPILQLEQEGVLLSSILEWINQKSSAGRIGTDESLVKLWNVHPDNPASGALYQLHDHLLRESEEEN